MIGLLVFFLSFGIYKIPYNKSCLIAHERMIVRSCVYCFYVSKPLLPLYIIIFIIIIIIFSIRRRKEMFTSSDSNRQTLSILVAIIMIFVVAVAVAVVAAITDFIITAAPAATVVVVVAIFAVVIVVVVIFAANVQTHRTLQKVRHFRIALQRKPTKIVCRIRKYQSFDLFYCKKR